MDLLTEVFLKQEEASKDYRLDIYDKICTFFTYCHEILTLFVKGNRTNQEIMNQHMKLLITNDRIDFKQIELINEIHIDNKKNATMISSNTLKFYLNLIKIHGKSPLFLSIFEIVIAQGDSDNCHLKKEIIKLIFNENYLDFIEPVKEIKIKDENSPWMGLDYKHAFSKRRMPAEYEDKFILILSFSLFKNIGINYITKAINVIGFETLFSRLFQLKEVEVKIWDSQYPELSAFKSIIKTKSAVYRL